MGKRRERQYQEAAVYHQRKKSLRSLYFVVYVLLGVYLVNLKINFFSIPEFLFNFNDWFVLVAGILLILTSIRFLKRR
jgi:cytochrome c biogenesis protein CcdA